MMPKYFNPLRVEEDGKSHSVGSSSNTIQKEAAWHPMRVQLYHAIMLIIVAWNAKPGTPLFRILENVTKYKYPETEPWIGDIKAVNTILRRSKLTMTEIENRVRHLAKGKQLKGYHFHLLNEELLKMEIDSYFI